MDLAEVTPDAPEGCGAVMANDGRPATRQNGGHHHPEPAKFRTPDCVHAAKDGAQPLRLDLVVDPVRRVAALEQLPPCHGPVLAPDHASLRGWMTHRP